MPEFRKRGIASKLVINSLELMKESLSLMQYNIKLILVTTKLGSIAQGLYMKSLGAEVVAKIPNLYSGDELIMTVS